MAIDLDPVPIENLAIYKLLYFIEVGLREFVIETLTTQYGPRWWKEHLPPDVLKKYRQGRESERNIKWSQLVPHHPLYHTDFPDLKKVIQNSENWGKVFRQTFGRQEILDGTLSELEPIRNKIAHNRKATAGDLDITQAAYRKLSTSIGETHFRDLIRRCTLAEDIRGYLQRLWMEAELAFKHCGQLEPLDRLETWENIQSTWWFDDDYLEYDLSGIRSYFVALVDYEKFPRVRGSGHQIEAWLRSQDLDTKYSQAMNSFSILLSKRT